MNGEQTSGFTGREVGELGPLRVGTGCSRRGHPAAGLGGERTFEPASQDCSNWEDADRQPLVRGCSAILRRCTFTSLICSQNDNSGDQCRLARPIANERAPTSMRLKAQVASRLNQLRATNLSPR